MSRRLLVDQIVFRIAGPIITGLVIYLLILLLYNNIAQILDSFISEELLICIGLSYLITETTRFILKFYPRIKSLSSPLWSIIILISISIALTVLIIIICLFIYYNYTLGYDPNISEIQIFLILYITLAVALISLHMSSHYLKQAYKVQLKNELKLKNQSKEDFTRFTRGINSELLFESLEAIITKYQFNKDKADQIIDDLSLVYRYTLTKNHVELIDIKEEIEALVSFVNLVDHLPYRTANLKCDIQHASFVVPGTLLFIVEHIIKSTIARNGDSLQINIYTSEEKINVRYEHHDKLTESFNLEKLQELNHSYRIYADTGITIKELGDDRIVQIPILIMKNLTDEHSDH